MKKLIPCLVVVALSLVQSARAGFRSPAVPLVSVDPFFSIWSRADKLADADTTHWSGAAQPMSAILTIDGKSFRLMGAKPAELPALAQVSTAVRPTQTVCRFTNEAVQAALIFSTPALPDDLETFSRPVTYVTLRVKAADGRKHALKFEYRISGALAANNDKDAVAAESEAIAGLVAWRLGRTEQKPLSRSGDRIRCDWGYAWLAAPEGAAFRALSAKPCAAAQQGIGFTRDFGTVGRAETHLLLAYDDIDSVMFFGRPLKAWWRRNGLSFGAMLAAAEADYPALMKKMASFDKKLLRDLARVGGAKYAAIAALAYRQSFAACKLVADANGQPLYFSKENASNGCMGTVDVLYPQIPHLLFMSPALVRATLAPILVYSSSARWTFPFAPHDIGQYPLGNGQVYGGGEHNERDQMPVEETGNMLICLGALSEIEGNAEFVSRWWPTVSKWAEFLAAKGFDPDNQLCTDDFAGHLAHNANLSIKAIMGLACYARMAEMRGENERAAAFHACAQAMVPQWMAAAAGGADGSGRLAFNQPGTWSMKYNLVWDRLLGFGLFPREVAQKEMAAYLKLQQPYGLPLDNRKAYTKADWIVWTATLTGNRADFDALIARLYLYLDETSDRIPFNDWYWADKGKYCSFIARSVVGGVYLPMLYDKDLWQAYARRGLMKTGPYAPIQ